MAGVVLEHELLGHLRRHRARSRLTGRKDCRSERTPSRTWKTCALASVPVDRDGDGVERADRLVGHALALEQRADGAQAVALERRLLVLLGR